MDPWGHFKTITKHKMLVMKYCFRIGLYKQGLLHDLSKYSPTEFIQGCKYYQGFRSPNNAEREDTGVSLAWLHHKGRNRHHYEHWVDYSLDTEKVIMGAKMPRRYVAEMIMDRISASRNYLGEEAYNDQQPLAYYMKSKEKLWFIHPETKRDLEALLRILADHGEKKLLHYIKYVYLKDEHCAAYNALQCVKRYFKKEQ
ncbi:MAG: catalase [Clostridiales bacterium]|nr:catalase [Candidatus Blautia equi]